MPELPDVTVYCERITALAGGHRLEKVRLASPFLLRTTSPTLAEAEGRTLLGARRLGKHLVFELEGGIFLVLHLMVAGRLHWKARGAKLPGKPGLAALDFDHASMLLLEHGTKRRASLHVVDAEGLQHFDRGGLDPLTATTDAVADRLRRERHTLKRSLTDPRLFDGIGGAYADEILFAARLGPLAWSDHLDDAAIARLTEAMRSELVLWTDRLRAEVGLGFPEKVTAFRPEMAVHGRYGEACRSCGAPIQRIVHGDRETNYCPGCQTGGKILADRAMSQLLKSDWPRTLEELEAVKRW